MLAQGFEVIGSGVTLVASKAVFRIDDVPLFHASVAMSFSEDRGGGDGNAARVAFNERLLLDENIELHGVNEQIIGLDGKQLQGGSHGLAAGLIDIPRVDALGIDFGDGPGEGMLADAWSEIRAAFRSEFFRVIQADNAPLGIENDRGGEDRTEERTPAGLIEASDSHPAKLSRRSLETGGAQTAHFRCAF